VAMANTIRTRILRSGITYSSLAPTSQTVYYHSEGSLL
jgi:hypothetical protein